MGGTTIDPRTGLKKQIDRIIEFRAVLEIAENPPRDQEPPQPKNFPAYWCFGNICRQIDPLDPENEDLPTELPTALTTAAVNCTVSGVVGKFTFVPKMEDAEIYNFELQDLQGQPIAGWFEVGGKV